MRRLLLLAALIAAGPAHAEVKIGAILSITGPTAAQGVGYRNSFQLMPTKVDGQDVTYIVRDDGGDPSVAINAAHRLISEDHVDAIVGPSFTASALAALPVLDDAHVPTVMMAPVDFSAQKDPWIFDILQPVPLMIDAVAEHMKAHGVKTVAYIGFADGFGDQVLAALKADAAKDGFTIVDEERYARADTTVEAQVLKAMSKHPDAIMIGGSATPGALPSIALAQRGYKGQVYNTHGVVVPDYIRVGGKAVEGVIAPTGPLAVYDQLPDSNPTKAVSADFMGRYIAKFGPESRTPFAGYSYDAVSLVLHAVPAALAHAQPGSDAFRAALRDAIEATHELVGTHGVYTMSPTDHSGMDARARVLVQVHDGAWTLVTK